MGLASALTTALTGMSAAETQIDVSGNNLANSQTVGFKASQAVFVTQFLQTQSLGSAPSSTDGGTNPRQTGLGVRVGAITPELAALLTAAAPPGVSPTSLAARARELGADPGEEVEILGDLVAQGLLVAGLRR